MISSYSGTARERITRKRIYISGPLTSSGKPEQNLDNAIEVAARLVDLGYAPLCPHLSWFIDAVMKFKHSTWMKVDLPWVSVSDAVLRLPGPSSGADQECREAFLRGIPIFHSISDLQKWSKV